MIPLARLRRRLSKLRFRLLGLATVKDIPTARFNEVIGVLKSAGWRKTNEYKGFDAWIDYGRVRMKKAGVKLKLEWDNWTEGSIEGPREVVEDLGRQFGFTVTHDWRGASMTRFDDLGLLPNPALQLMNFSLALEVQS